METDITSPASLRQIIDYCPEIGVMFWLPRSPCFFKSGKRTPEHAAANWNSRYAGTRALSSIGNHGYMRGNIGNKSFLAHRVVMAMCLDTWEFGFVDHINGNKLDNRRENLRLCSNAENLRNSKPRGGSSKYKGVCFHNQNKNWISNITIDGKTIHIGSFDDEVSAALAYDEAAKRLHGEYARINFR